ncbi:MAG: hypothetical protein FJW88_10855 [Actinobacteria bacterium]|nr:hypothetical protein [Actinomycetota bacterium]
MDVAAPRAVRAGELLSALSDEPAEWLGSEVCTLAGHIDATTSRVHALVGELDQREAWRR